MPPKVDIWMPLYIGDYLADTSHLDAERSGAYLHLLMHYWKRGPLPDDIPATISIAKLRGKDASSIAQALLDEFFMKNGDGCWHQKRQDIEREKWQGRKHSAVEKAKKAAAGRWGDASSKPQALLEPCPLPSSSSSPLPLPEPPEEKINTLSLFVDDVKPKQSAKDEVIGKVWEYYRQQFDRRADYSFSDTRKNHAEKAWKSLTRKCKELGIAEDEQPSAILDWWCAAIEFMKADKFHNGQNDQHVKYNDWENLFSGSKWHSPDKLTDHWLNGYKFPNRGVKL